jgi:hypothetical protein
MIIIPNKLNPEFAEDASVVVVLYQAACGGISVVPNLAMWVIMVSSGPMWFTTLSINPILIPKMLTIRTIETFFQFTLRVSI